MNTLLLFLFLSSYSLSAMEQSETHSVQDYEELKSDHSFMYHLLNALNLHLGGHDESDKDESIRSQQELEKKKLEQKYVQLYADLINKTPDFVKQVNQTCIRFGNEAARVYTHKDLFNQLIKVYNQKEPIFLLNECTEIAYDFGISDDCPMSRFVHNYRDKFEKKVSNSLAAIIKKNPHTHYVGFASGLGLPDLILLTKALHTLSKDNTVDSKKIALNIHLIDLIHDQYAQACDQLNKSHEVTTKQNIYELIEKNSSLKDTLHLESIHKSQLMNEQFISWFNHFFKASTIKLFAHASEKSYLNHQEKYKFPAADIIVAADMEDEECKMNQALKDYEELCQKTLSYNPSSKNYLLCTNSANKKVQIKKYRFRKYSSDDLLLGRKTIIPIFSDLK